MAESRIPVDLLNPGQVFACIGMLEAASVLLDDARAAFDWNAGGKAEFVVSATGSMPPAERVLEFLEGASIVARAPAGSPNVSSWKPAWGDKPEEDLRGAPFPYGDPTSPATLPALLRDSNGNEFAIDHWGDATRRDKVKFWAGSGGKPGAAILREAIGLVKTKIRKQQYDPYALSSPQSISFRFDWRRDYIPVQDGFSPNKHKSGPAPISMVGYPVVEILAAMGMAHARPRRKTKLEYHYSVLGYLRHQFLEPVFHRAALGAAVSPVPGWPFRRFVMWLDWPGKEGQARCITQVIEETTNK
ncbi:MAG: type I-U CRISPR-associated protein Cas8c [Gammaproteobacteria bacterium]|nr:type I-U CRISPR-associated protein Cas8c [Chloroflexota bacterium]MXW45571.1 type I-U CRISPR-associated protein Cas8c [Gammaproteobacteria bacterium]MYD01418.1 type I-U CRISPR-associated protein Cas8c [Gammaproteobacteria bacterium]MYI24111.1 type I-U CRISPR-associated protein Cas8c [Gammaproteobacteria bacterium]